MDFETLGRLFGPYPDYAGIRRNMPGREPAAVCGQRGFVGPVRGKTVVKRPTDCEESETQAVRFPVLRISSHGKPDRSVLRILPSYFPTMSRMSAMIFSASASAEALSRLSLYIRMIGSVFDLRRCTHWVGKSIFTPSMSLICSCA